MTQQERQERSREKIYRAALEEFGASGYDAVNMEQICGKHGISKGMMYHYYSSKDQLFLLCVERTFADLNACIEQEAEKWADQDILETFKAQLLMREAFFNCHPLQKTVFETAVLRPPKGLAKQIRELYAPIREKTRGFCRSSSCGCPCGRGSARKRPPAFWEESNTFCSIIREGSPSKTFTPYWKRLRMYFTWRPTASSSRRPGRHSLPARRHLLSVQPGRGAPVPVPVSRDCHADFRHHRHRGLRRK